VEWLGPFVGQSELVIRAATAKGVFKNIGQRYSDRHLNFVRDRAREFKHYREVGMSTALALIPVKPEVYRSLEAIDVHAALKKLPLDLRVSLVRYHLEGLPVSEIAGELGVTPQAVRSRVHRGLKLLRLMMKQKPEIGG
jgi:RNA polymerase sigma factor (sigma-70 family)